MARLGKSQRDKDITQVASVAAYDERGRMLFFRRRDNGRWSLPGGRLNTGEAPHRAAVRELLEETGLKARSLTKLGVEKVPGKDVWVHAYAAAVAGVPTGERDPDEEAGEFRWMDPGRIPKEILENLHSPKNVVLKLLDLQDWDAKDGQKPTKSVGSRQALAKTRIENTIPDHDWEGYWARQNGSQDHIRVGQQVTLSPRSGHDIDVEQKGAPASAPGTITRIFDGLDGTVAMVHVRNEHTGQEHRFLREYGNINGSVWRDYSKDYLPVTASMGWGGGEKSYLAGRRDPRYASQDGRLRGGVLPHEVWEKERSPIAEYMGYWTLFHTPFVHGLYKAKLLKSDDWKGRQAGLEGEIRPGQNVTISHARSTVQGYIVGPTGDMDPVPGGPRAIPDHLDPEADILKVGEWAEDEMYPEDIPGHTFDFEFGPHRHSPRPGVVEHVAEDPDHPERRAYHVRVRDGVTGALRDFVRVPIVERPEWPSMPRDRTDRPEHVPTRHDWIEVDQPLTEAYGENRFVPLDPERLRAFTRVMDDPQQRPIGEDGYGTGHTPMMAHSILRWAWRDGPQDLNTGRLRPRVEDVRFKGSRLEHRPYMAQDDEDVALKSEGRFRKPFEKKDLDPAHGYTFQVEHHPFNVPGVGNHLTTVTAHARDGVAVGEAQLLHQDNGTMEAAWVHVEPEHRRRGIASAMYAFGQQQTGKKVVASAHQTEEGRAFWAGAGGRAFGKSEPGDIGADDKDARQRGDSGAIREGQYVSLYRGFYGPKRLGEVEPSPGRIVRVHEYDPEGGFPGRAFAVEVEDESTGETIPFARYSRSTDWGPGDHWQALTKMPHPEMTGRWARMADITSGHPWEPGWASRSGPIWAAWEQALHHGWRGVTSPFSDYIHLVHEPPLVKSELSKMALGDVPVGPPVPADHPGESFDYSHCLSQHLRDSGHKIVVRHVSKDRYSRAWAQFVASDGTDAGFVDGAVERRVLSIGTSQLHGLWRNKGIGTAMYEALLAHAHNVLGARSIAGLEHSSSAHKVHVRLAAKHGLDYHPDYVRNRALKNPSDYDEAAGPYEYALKSEGLFKGVRWPVPNSPEHEEFALRQAGHQDYIEKGQRVSFRLFESGLPGAANHARPGTIEKVNTDDENGGRVYSVHVRDEETGRVHEFARLPEETWSDQKPAYRWRQIRNWENDRTARAHAQDGVLPNWAIVRQQGQAKAARDYVRALDHGFHHGAPDNLFGSDDGYSPGTMVHLPFDSYPPATEADATHINFPHPDPTRFRSTFPELVHKSEQQELEEWVSLRKSESSSNSLLAQNGVRPLLDIDLEAASFLAGRGPVDLRQRLWSHEGDQVGGALAAHGLEDSDAVRRALDAVRPLLRKPTETRKKERISGTFSQMAPAVPEAQAAAEAVSRALKGGEVHPVHLGGKHSAGAQLAQDPETNRVYLLKPGSGGDSPSKGISEEHVSQSAREAGFWHVANLWGLGGDCPRADLLLAGGRQVACIEFLSKGWGTLEDRQREDPSLPHRVFEPLRVDGRLFRWSVLDLVLGQTDRHAGNIMISDAGDVRLIDAGAAFAGRGFDPAHDWATYVPAYLRYGAPVALKFNQLPVGDRLRYLQTAPAPARPGLESWLNSLDEKEASAVLNRYGVDPAPVVRRLQQLKDLVSGGKPVDEACNHLWVTL